MRVLRKASGDVCVIFEHLKGEHGTANAVIMTLFGAAIGEELVRQLEAKRPKVSERYGEDLDD